MSNKRYSLLGCPRCGGRKDPNRRTYGMYKIKYNNDDKLKLKCRCCGFILYFTVIKKQFQKDNYVKNYEGNQNE